MDTAHITGQILHASCVCAHGKGLLILGPSGAGKSALALQLITLGAQLVADDRCYVHHHNGALIASAPSSIAGLIEARGIGILRLPFCAQTPVMAAVDLAEPVHDSPPPRLPARRRLTLQGLEIDYLHCSAATHFPSALMCYLMGEYSE